MTAGLLLPAQADSVAGPNGDTGPPTSVALMVPRNGPLRMLLEAYLKGPGRTCFELRDPPVAQVWLADAGSTAARAALQQALHQHRRPVVAIAARDPMVDGAVWLRHPFSFEALQQSVAVARGAEAGLVDSPSAPLRPVERASAKPVSASPAADLPPSPAARTPFGRRAEGDWTGTAVWLALGLLIIVGLASLLGWQPAAEPPPPRALQREVAQPVTPDDALRRAVADSLRDYRGHSPADLAEIRRQLGSLAMEQRLADDQADRRAAVALLMRPGVAAGQLAWDPQRLPAVQMALARPVDAGTENLRRSVDEAVARALAQPSSGGGRR